MVATTSKRRFDRTCFWNDPSILALLWRAGSDPSLQATIGSDGSLRKVFAQMDKNSDGKIHCGEFAPWKRIFRCGDLVLGRWTVTPGGADGLGVHGARQFLPSYSLCSGVLSLSALRLSCFFCSTSWAFKLHVQCCEGLTPSPFFFPFFPCGQVDSIAVPLEAPPVPALLPRSRTSSKESAPWEEMKNHRRL